MNKEKPKIALMSIKPRWAHYVIKGNKQWEYRKQTLKSLRDAARILVYATAPECRVVGCFYVPMVVEGDLHTVWYETKWGGIPEKDYYDYYQKYDYGLQKKVPCKTAYAARVNTPWETDEKPTLSEIRKIYKDDPWTWKHSIWKPPMSWMWISPNECEKLYELLRGLK